MYIIMPKKTTEEVLSPNINKTEIIKEVKVQDTGRQFIIQIPADVINSLDIEKGDKVIFKVPLKEKDKYSIKFEKLEHGKTNKKA